MRYYDLGAMKEGKAEVSSTSGSGFFDWLKNTLAPTVSPQSAVVVGPGQSSLPSAPPSSRGIPSWLLVGGLALAGYALYTTNKKGRR